MITGRCLVFRDQGSWSGVQDLGVRMRGCRVGVSMRPRTACRPLRHRIPARRVEDSGSRI